MAGLWPWLAIAGVGALHGLNPASGWIFAAAWGLGSQGGAQALRALVPIALGHAASVALVAAAVLMGRSLDRAVLLAVAGVMLACMALLHLWGRLRRPRLRAPAGHAALALWSFMVSSAHGAGLMLVPALMPLCLGNAGAGIGASGSLMLALAAVGVHMAAMLVVSAAVASGACSIGRRVWLRSG